MFKCTVANCDRVFNTEKGRKQHITTFDHTKVRNFNCGGCGKVHRSLVRKVACEKRHNLQFKCTYCTRYASARKFDLQRHHRTCAHNPLNKTRCKTCDRVYTRPLQLYNHIKCFHKNTNVQFCTTCEIIFANMSLKSIHVCTPRKKK